MLYPIFVWLNDSALGAWVRDSSWAVPWVETFHLFGLAILLGVIAIIDLGLLGVAMRRQPIAEIAKPLAPYAWVSLIVMGCTGFLLFMQEAERCYSSWPFRIKMSLLATAIIFHFTVHRKLTQSDKGGFNPRWGKLVGATSLTLWFGIALAGRAIGFL
jgi:hypothetical protein